MRARTPIAFALAAALVGGCAGLVVPPEGPGTVADATVLDERAALAVELAYSAAATALEMAVDAGVVRGERAALAAQYEARAYRAVLAARAAYETGNATSYADALDLAQSAVRDVVEIIRG